MHESNLLLKWNDDRFQQFGVLVGLSHGHVFRRLVFDRGQSGPCTSDAGGRLVRHQVALHPSREGLCGVRENGRSTKDRLLVEGSDGVRRGRQDSLRIAADAAESQLVVLDLQLVDERLQ